MEFDNSNKWNNVNYISSHLITITFRLRDRVAWGHYSPTSLTKSVARFESCYGICLDEILPSQQLNHMNSGPCSCVALQHSSTAESNKNEHYMSISKNYRYKEVLKFFPQKGWKKLKCVQLHQPEATSTRIFQRLKFFCIFQIKTSLVIPPGVIHSYFFLKFIVSIRYHQIAFKWLRRGCLFVHCIASCP